MPTLTEMHFGVITDNNDPQRQGRIKVLSQSLVGANTELPDWIEPASNLLTSNGGLGALFLPEIGSTVELTVDAHDTDDDMPGEAFLRNPNIKWRLAVASEKGGPMALPEDLVTDDYPNVRGWVTKAGHKLLFNDKGGIKIIAKDGGSIELTTDGKIVLSSPTLLGAGATELMLLGNAFMTLYNAHSHATGVGPSGPPLVLMTTAQLSQAGNKVT